MDFSRHRDKPKGIINEHKGYFHTFDIGGFLYWSGRRILNVTFALSRNTSVKQILRVIPGISYALVYFELMNDFIINAFASKRSIPTRIFHTIMAVVGTVIAIMGFIFSTKLVNAIGALSNILSNLWDCGTIVASRLWGSLKNNDDPETNRKANSKVAESVHKIAVNLLFFAGFAMMIHPGALIAGGVLILCITAYAIIDRFKLNPLRWMGNQIFNYPFKAKQQDIVIENNPALQLTEKAAIKIEKKANPKIKFKNQQYRPTLFASANKIPVLATQEHHPKSNSISVQRVS